LARGLDGTLDIKMDSFPIDALMDAYYGLTNISGDHGSLERGCCHVEQIVNAYRAAPLEPKETLILSLSREATAAVFWTALNLA